MKEKELVDIFYDICKKIVDHAVEKTDWDTSTIIRKQCEALIDYIEKENIKKMVPIKDKEQEKGNEGISSTNEKISSTSKGGYSKAYG